MPTDPLEYGPGKTSVAPTLLLIPLDGGLVRVAIHVRGYGTIWKELNGMEAVRYGNMLITMGLGATDKMEMQNAQVANPPV